MFKIIFALSMLTFSTAGNADDLDHWCANIDKNGNILTKSGTGGCEITKLDPDKHVVELNQGIGQVQRSVTLKAEVTDGKLTSEAWTWSKAWGNGDSREKDHPKELIKEYDPKTGAEQRVIIGHYERDREKPINMGIEYYVTYDKGLCAALIEANKKNSAKLDECLVLQANMLAPFKKFNAKYKGQPLRVGVTSYNQNVKDATAMERNSFGWWLTNCENRAAEEKAKAANAPATVEQ